MRSSAFPHSFFVVLGVAALILMMAQDHGLGPLDLCRRRQARSGACAWAFRSTGVLISTYVIAGLCAGIGAVILAGRTDAGSPLFGNLLELDTIAAVIIGGASFLGGRGHVGHALIGAIMIGVIRNALNLLNVDIFFQLIVIGVVIVLAVEADVLRNSSRRPRPRAAGGEAAMTSMQHQRRRARRSATRTKRFGAVLRSTTSASKRVAAKCWRCSATMAPANRR